MFHLRWKKNSAIKKSQNIRNIIVETGGGITPVGLRHSDELGFDNYFIEGTRYQIGMVSWVSKELSSKENVMDHGGLIVIL